ncbi:Histidine phosphatase superfamily (branch 1) [Falsiruegeria litorea R37]|uniref:Histidine phosphatase superfamily (Branch 1) n=1 Tax=Falsiruegeria litorea R37 TaxID=1200284 RepID=A0A1Y5TR83_9RHOB|nr:histidine phosphatase family protein [Falsiruegeria litorea]SLN66359.1 Histidine phosphatase superfamily (branch 1) [Falsiruegeria litorea R37]
MTHAGRIAIYLTHAEVVIDPAIPVPDWGLSPVGAERTATLAARLPQSPIQVISSAERKALETAWPLAARFGTPVTVRPGMHENDRSATGFLPGPEFETAADAFFATPHQSIRGWERAIDAQSRIADEVRRAVNSHLDDHILFCGHGGVGTLLYCDLAGKPIDRTWDQTGGGHWFAFDPDSWTALSQWAPMETLSF